MKIAHVITRFIRGGADENTLLTVNAQAEQGHDVVLIHGPESHEDMFGRLHTAVETIEIPSLIRDIDLVKDIACLNTLAKELKRSSPDIVHTHTSKAGVIGRFAARLAEAPVIIHSVHILAFDNVWPGKMFLFQRLEKAAARYTHGFISVSEALRKACIDAGVGTEDIHYVVPSGMDVSSYRNAAPADWRSLWPDETRPTRRPRFVLAVGALESRKRIAELIDAFEGVAKSAPDAVLMVAGDGPERPRIEKLIRERNLEGQVMLLGHVDDLPRYIHLADVCVHVASREGLPRVVLQFAMSGKPVVATKLPGIEQVVLHEKSGLLCPVDDFDAVRDALERLLGDAELRNRFGKEAWALDFSGWDTQEMIRSIDDVYRRAILARQSTGVMRQSMESYARGDTPRPSGGRSSSRITG
ncbi:MAG: glycosyltransferase family 4 protein [Pseudomonadota bacterium]